MRHHHHTLHNVLIFGALGAGVGLVLSGHRRVGVMAEAAALGLAAAGYHREARERLRTLPRHCSTTGKAVARALIRTGHFIGRVAA